MFSSSKVDKQIKETVVEFIVQGLVNDSDDEEEEPHPQKTSSGPVHRKPAKPAKKHSSTSRTPVTSGTYILTFGIRKGKQYKLKASEETRKFCNRHKRQT